MAKAVPDAVLDAALDVVTLADELYLTDAEPTNYADIGVGATILVGPIAVTPGDGNGDFTIADGDASGRKVTVAAQSDDAVATGDATHVVLATGGATDLLRYVTTFTSQGITSGNTVNIGAWDIEIEDPT
jgi:outer membrane autotransporter protein